jgi:Na+/phosphate symporter
MNESYSYCLAGLSLLVYSQRTLGGVITRENMTRLYDWLQLLIRNRMAGFALGFGLGAVSASSAVPVLMLMTFVDKGGISLSQGFAILLGAMAGAPHGVFWPESFGLNRGVVMLLVAAVGIMVTPRRKRPYFDVLFCCGLLFFGWQMLVRGLSGTGLLAPLHGGLISVFIQKLLSLDCLPSPQ